ncbi:MAG: chemotaxis response regulator protein-glutamate methylesterase [Gammaproteobacteria bacterium]|nr:chemotaxis response regulator protein-glutamate methylesterase [Gammaproteobacteria bacterium]MDH5630049.1 chemotaxis response regulator protein-glutamate methylesterase [Gammaproteobacteria bacterium]
MAGKKVRVLIVDDSAFIRVLLTQILENHEDITVVATAEDPYDARDKIKKYKPDVITLDVEMPKMDGLTFLKNIMRLHPLPVVMVSTLTQAGADITMQALNLGAFDFVGKPSTEVKEKLNELSDELTEKVIAASRCNIKALEKEDIEAQTVKSGKYSENYELIAVGASTGGTEAIYSLVSRLPTDLPPIVMAQHIPDVFSTSYAKRLDRECKISVMEVRGPQKLEFGHAYLAPGHMHMQVKRKSDGLWAYLTDGEPVNRHKPAVDVLFDSVLDTVNDKCMAALLTGMGQDGAKGLLRLKEAGAHTIAQDEESSVVWGMPGAAVKLGAAKKIISLQKLPDYMVSNL